MISGRREPKRAESRPLTALATATATVHGTR